MKHLTEKDYWENIYKEHEFKKESSFSWLKKSLKRLLGSRVMDLLWPYDDHLLWRSVMPSVLPQGAAGLSVVEIGSAPGDFLVRFAKTLGAEPYGVEYTGRGAEKNRAVFEAAGYSSENVIEADFFSSSFLEANANRFDIVVSRGFIEHFDDVREVVDRHIAILKDGGLLLILIPNLRGIYYLWTKLFNPDQLPLHNLEIMKSDNFRKACTLGCMDIIRCGYFGTFSFWMFTAPSGSSFINRVIRLLHVFQRGLNLLFRLLFSGRGCESSFLSPNLILVARKTKLAREAVQL